MKIVLHLDNYTPQGGNPGAKRIRVFSKTLREAGHEVIILSNGKLSKEELELIDQGNNPERIIHCPTIPIGSKSSFRRLLNNFSFTVTSFFRGLFIRRPDIIFTSSPPAMLSLAACFLARIKRSKLIYDVRDIWPDIAVEMDSFAEDSMSYRFFDRIRKSLNKHADIITTVTPRKVTHIQDRLAENQKAKVHFVSNGLDLQFTQLSEDPTVIERFNLAEKINVVFVGNLGLAQGLESFLALAATHREDNIQFLLFGTGLEEENLKALAKSEGLQNVIFAGTIPYHQVYTVFSRAHIAYVPLKDKALVDSVPTKMYEALALGCPVLLLANNLGDAANILEETGFGVCVDPENIEEIQAGFQYLLEHLDALEAKKDEAKAIIRTKHTLQNSSKILLGLMEDLGEKASR